MSIEVIGLSKVYGQQKAVDQVSFSIKEGEIVGFLGPNGAGKSTTMKIISGYLKPTSGTVYVCGTDVLSQPLHIKGLIGYLPEHNPLYLDMYVVEFLDFIARATHVIDRKKRVNEVIELTGLTLERRKKIGQLSKGYRQRVGIAHALLHNPKVLILDEPTSGLDPNQVLEIRKLILSLKKGHTVMLSTHIMQEVEAMCDRVIIINRGKLVADEDTSQISEKVKGNNTMLVKFKKEIDIKTLRDRNSIVSVEDLGEGQYRVTGTAETDLAELLFNTAVQNGTIIIEQQQEKLDLESVFQQLTKNV